MPLQRHLLRKRNLSQRERRVGDVGKGRKAERERKIERALIGNPGRKGGCDRDASAWRTTPVPPGFGGHAAKNLNVITTGGEGGVITWVCACLLPFQSCLSFQIRKGSLSDSMAQLQLAAPPKAGGSTPQSFRSRWGPSEKDSHSHTPFLSCFT